MAVERYDIGLKFRTKGSVGVWHSATLQRGKGAAEPCSCWVDRRGGTYQVKGGHTPPVRDKDRDRGKAGLCGQYGGVRGPEAVCSPTLNLAPINLHLCGHALGRDEDVGAI